MPIKFTANIFYNVIRYRILSHIARGEKKRIYRDKYHAIKNFINTFDITNYYILGLPVLSIKYCHTYKCHTILGIPIVIQIFHKNSYTVRLFGISIYKRKFKPEEGIPPVICINSELRIVNAKEKTIDFPELSKREKAIYDFLKQLQISKRG